MTTAFFEHQEKARRNSRRLVVLFGLCVSAVVAGVYLLAAWLGQYAGAERGTVPGWWDTRLFLSVTSITLLVIGGGALLRFVALRGGGRSVAEGLGGRLVNPQTKDPAERRLLNVVEEMALASGIPVPSVYVLDREKGINAFAAGRTTTDAVVAVTRGALEQFTRDELQGVVGHEFSHILNGDMRLNIRLIGLLGGLLAIATVGRVVWSLGSTGRKKDGAAFAALGLAVMLIGYVGVLVGRLLQAAISRQREFLADASAVQFTRNPKGIGDALRRIGGWLNGSRVTAPQAEEASHMFFGAPFSSLFASHPPLPERIRRIEGAQADIPDGLPGRREAASAAAASAIMGLAASLGAHPSGSSSRRSGAADAVPGGPAGSGGLANGAAGSAAALLAGIPQALRDSVDAPLGAAALTCALLFDRDAAIRGRQIARLSELTVSVVAQEAASLYPHLQALPLNLRMPLLDLALPALRELSRSQMVRLAEALRELARADERITPFEFCMLWLVDRRVSLLSGRRAAREKSLGVAQLKQHVAVLLSAVAWAGHPNRDEAALAFSAGADLAGLNLSGADLLPAQAAMAALGKTLDALAAAGARARTQAWQACEKTVLADRKVRLEELELLRVVGLALDLPLPPSVASEN
jgi:Zn-dependent protease with chaperone function